MNRIVTLIAFTLGLNLGLFSYNLNEKIRAYKQYEDAVEKVLDECNKQYDFMDTIGEGEAYQEYLDAKDNL